MSKEILELADELKSVVARAGREWAYYPLVARAEAALRAVAEPVATLVNGFRRCPADGETCLCDDGEARGCYETPGSREYPAPAAPVPASVPDPDEIDYDDPRFNQGVEHVVDMLARTIGAEGWHHGDGSEDYDCDLEETLRNILAASGLYDRDTCEFASLPAPEAAPSDIERAFQDACDEAGCDYDNEALLMAIHALKSEAAPTREEIVEQCAAIATGWGCQPEGRAAILALKSAPHQRQGE